MGPASSSERVDPAEARAGDRIPAALLNNPDYEFLRELNRGAMGVVYLVRNRRMDRLECLKIVDAELLKRSGSRERFEREIRTVAKVSHPYIVTAFSAPTLDGMLAFAMEYVDGIDLAHLVAERGAVPVSNACKYAHHVAEALQYAHDKSLVHRDIKPGNLMLVRDGNRETIKILDFGLAKATSESPSNGVLTETGQMLGTPQFMAPEQIKDAGNADIRADIYSLGCTLYFLLAGVAPFQNKSGLYDLLHAQQFETAQPLNEVWKNVPAELATIVAKMMAKDPLHRFQQPRDVAVALVPFFKEGLEEIAFNWDAGRSNIPALSLAAPGADSEVMIKADKPEPPAAAPAATVTALRGAVVTPTMIDEVGARSPQRVTGNSLNSPSRIHPNHGQPRPIWGRIAAVVVLVVVAGLWWTGIIDVKTRYGTLVLEVNEPKADVYIDGAETDVDWDDTGKKTEIRIETGNRRVEVSKNGYSVAAKEVRIKDGESHTFKARLLPMLKVGSSDVPISSAGTTTSDTGTPGTVTAATVPATVPTPARDLFSGQSPGQLREDNDLAIKFLWCPAGEFTMGSPHTEKDRGNDEEPVHVVLTTGFWLGKNEITQAQWVRLMGTTPWKSEVNVQDGPDIPATFVSWEEAGAFCAKLTAGELSAGRLAKGCEYALPTDAQWEYACRAGTKSAFSFGDDAKRLPEFGWFKTNTTDAGQKYAHAVNQKQPNAWGLHDMHGNVFEWCRDVFTEKLKGGNDPFIAAVEPQHVLQHVYRGGGWFTSQSYCRSAIRRGLEPSFRGNGLGFRVACIKAAGG